MSEYFLASPIIKLNPEDSTYYKLTFSMEIRKGLWVEFEDGEEYEAISEQIRFEAMNGKR